MRQLAILLFTLFTTCGRSQGLPQFAIQWDGLGTDETSSMPLGNGDVVVNAWTEPQGDLVLLLAKTDAWSENAQLLKLGRVRIGLSPNPFAGADGVTQTLSIADGCMEVRSAEGDVVRVWVDANSPVVRIETATRQPVTMRAATELWRTRERHLTQEQVNQNVFNYWEWRSCPDGITFLPDRVMPAEAGQTAWCHFNATSMYPVVLRQEHLADLVDRYPDPLLHRCFGAAVRGEGFMAQNQTLLQSVAPATTHRLGIHVLTEQVDSPQQWLDHLRRQIAATEHVAPADAWQAHAAWWAAFWNRSWVKVGGTPQADEVTQGYAVHRYMVACSSRGGYPVKFNGGHFTVGHDIPLDSVSTAENHDPDFRDWGSCYWHQNTRHIYYPLVASGDYDLLQPWFNLYLDALPLALDRTRLYYGHGGASFIETIHFWGLPNLMDFGWDNPGPDPQSGYMRWHTQGALEVVVNMLDYFDNTQDTLFLRQRLVPFAEAILTYYNEHWPRTAEGKIRFDPHQSIEMYQTDCADPTPDIAGLLCVTERLLALGQLTPLCQTLRRDLPPLPTGTTQQGKLPLRPDAGDPDGRPVVLPAWRYGEPSNGENPELYCVFPYRNFCLGKPQLQLALNTFEARRYPFDRCWGQDGMEAALLGLTDVARQAAVSAFTCYGDQRFKWFWKKVADYSPDMDNGGTGAMTLQLMLMQCNGREIRLLPAWPADWTAHFRLHAPGQTIVEGRVEQGRLTDLKVTPESRRADVVVGAQP